MKGVSQQMYYSPQAKDQATGFRFAYERNDIPVRIDHNSKGPILRWTKEWSNLDYDRLLPLLCEGLRETKFPYDFLAEEAFTQILQNQPAKITTVIPHMIQPLKAALRTDDPKIILRVLKILQKIASDVPGGGRALVPYYRQLLPVLGQHKNKNVNLGDNIEYGQWKNQNLADVIDETLQILEKNGGPDAFINIRYVIPLYESCICNR